MPARDHATTATQNGTKRVGFRRGNSRQQQCTDCYRDEKNPIRAARSHFSWPPDSRFSPGIPCDCYSCLGSESMTNIFLRFLSDSFANTLQDFCNPSGCGTV